MEIKKNVSILLVFMLGVGSVGLVWSKNQAHIPLKTVLSGCRNVSIGDDASLEVGTLELHFSENPSVNSLPSTKNRSNSDHIFFIPAEGVLNNEVRLLMQAASQHDNKWYKVSLSIEKKPIQGIKVVLTYDPEKVSMQYVPFDIMGVEKGVTFRFYNKSMINRLQARERSLLRLVHLAPFRITV